MSKDAAEMNDKELDAFCDKLGLTSGDWDEGGGFVHEAVVRVVQQEKQKLVGKLLDWAHEYCPHSAIGKKRFCSKCWDELKNEPWIK